MASQDNVTKGFSVVEKGLEKYWDMWLLALGSFSWSQEQLESAVQKYLSQRKVERDEALKVTEDLLQQAKKNQLHFQNLVKEAVTSAVENANIPNFNYINDLTKKVDELSKKVEND